MSNPRISVPQRNQIEFREFCLDRFIRPDDIVRAVWDYVCGLDMSSVLGGVRAVEGGPGRNAIDPRILMCLWMYATIDGQSRGRKIARLAERDLAYMWICGGVGVNYHAVCDFRKDHGELFRQFLIDSIAALMNQGLVTLQTVAQDGMRVRAHAGGSSFRSEDRLKEFQEQAAEHVRQLEEADQDDDGDAPGQSPEGEELSPRRLSARQRAARERKERIDRALENLEELKAQKENRKKGTGQGTRASTSDPEARTMKMGDGGFRPAFNVQFATDSETRMIVGCGVSNVGSDGGLMPPMLEKLAGDYGRVPEEYLVDGGTVTKDAVTKAGEMGTRVVGPMNDAERFRANGKDPHDRRDRDNEAMAAFRERMRSPQEQAKLKTRPSIAEFPNAECRNRGLHQYPVRGLKNVLSHTLLHVLTFNFMRMRHLGFSDRLGVT